MNSAKLTYLCRVDELVEGAARGFAIMGAACDTMFVVRRNDKLKAWSNSCPHITGAPLAWRKDAYLSADGKTIVCYGHGAVFDIETGACTHGPCVGQALAPVGLEQDRDGLLWAHSEVDECVGKLNSHS